MLDGLAEKSNTGWYRLFVIMNADYREQSVKLPGIESGKWHRVIDTSLNSSADFMEDGKEILLDPSDIYIANSRSTVLLLAR